MTLISKITPVIKDRMTKVLAGVLVSAASLYAPMLSAAPIYKVVDSKTGQVTFTDNPQSYDQQAGKQISQTGVTTGNNSADQTSNSQASSNQNNSQNSIPSKNSGAALNAQSVTNLPEMTTQTRAVNYQLVMIEPSEERAYRRPAQSIDVQLQITPALQVGDTVTIYLDDTVVAQGLTASIASVDILPGEHSIKAAVTNKRGQVIKQVSRTIYVIQNTARLQQNKKIAEQLMAYERLPWYQKLLLKRRQDKNATAQSLNKPSANTPMTLEIPAIR